MKPNNELSTSEKLYLENEEFNKQNVDEIKIKGSKATAFRKANGFSLTFDKLMKKWNCATADEWRALRKQHKKEGYIGPKKEKKPVESAPAPTYQKEYNKKHNR